MDQASFKRRVTALRARLDGISADTVWIIQPENRRYLSGFKAEDTQFTESSGSLVINDRMAVLLTDSRYTTEAENEASDFEVVTLKKGLAEGFPGVMAKVKTESLGFEEDFVTFGLYRDVAEKLKTLSPPVSLVPLNGLVEDLREVKDEGEIMAMDASAAMMSRILDQVIPWVSPGLTEKEVAWRIEDLARKSGADRLAFPAIVASGPNSALPHAVPTDRKLREGEPIVLDVGVRLDGYCCDMTRTVFLGEPTAEFKRIYAIVRKAQLAALREIHPGVQSDHPDGVARRIIAEAGFGDCFGHGLGHGVGLQTHERPRLSPLKPVRLKENVVVTVEPGIYLPGKGGVRLEEMVVVEKGGPRILTTNRSFYEFSL
jgi:Xaa-Pro aminopeptidase